MAFQLGTGLAGAALAAPTGLFEELGLKPSGFNNMVKGSERLLGGHAWAIVTVPTIAIGPIVRDRTLMNMSPEEFDEVVAVNLRGTWSVTNTKSRSSAQSCIGW